MHEWQCLLFLLYDLLSTNQDDKKPSKPVEESREESMSDINDREGSKPTSTSTQHDKLYTAEGILDPRKRKAEKKRRKANKFSALADMDADYDFKVDYQMQDVADDGEDDESNEAPADDKDGIDETKDNDPMTGVNDAWNVASSVCMSRMVLSAKKNEQVWGYKLTHKSFVPSLFQVQDNRCQLLKILWAGLYV